MAQFGDVSDNLSAGVGDSLVSGGVFPGFPQVIGILLRWCRYSALHTPSEGLSVY